MIAVEVEHRLADFTLALQFRSDARLLAVTGPSGAGKTTLLKVIAGLVRPARGRVSVGDEVFLDTADGIERPVHRRRIGFVFQEDRLFPHLTVAQNLSYGRWFSGDPLPPRRRHEIVAMLGIGALLNRRLGGLSGGERQRAAIGRALFASPRLLLMDEPLAAVDEARRREILPLIEDIRDHVGVPIVYVSHNDAEVARLADAVLPLSAGVAPDGVRPRRASGSGPA